MEQTHDWKDETAMAAGQLLGLLGGFGARLVRQTPEEENAYLNKSVDWLLDRISELQKKNDELEDENRKLMKEIDELKTCKRKRKKGS